MSINNKTLADKKYLDSVIDNYNANPQNWWAINKDKIILLIICAIVGALIGNLSKLIDLIFKCCS